MQDLGFHVLDENDVVNSQVKPFLIENLANLGQVVILFLFIFKTFYLLSDRSIHLQVNLTLGMPRDQEGHTVPTEPAKRPSPGDDFGREIGREDGREVCRLRVERGSWNRVKSSPNHCDKRPCFC